VVSVAHQVGQSPKCRCPAHPMVFARMPCHNVNPADKNAAPPRKLDELVTAENQLQSEGMESVEERIGGNEGGLGLQNCETEGRSARSHSRLTTPRSFSPFQVQNPHVLFAFGIGRCRMSRRQWSVVSGRCHVTTTTTPTRSPLSNMACLPPSTADLTSSLLMICEKVMAGKGRNGTDSSCDGPFP
jgi:hypothetical protein